MSSKVVEKFKEIIGEDPVFHVEAPVSPLLLVITWQENVHPLHILCINKGRQSHLALNEKRYVAIGTDKFRDFFSGKVSIEELRNSYKSWEEDALNFYNKFTETDLGSLSDSELTESLNEIDKLFHDLARITLFIENVEYKQILEVVGVDFKSELDSIWEKATEGIFLSFDYRRLENMIEVISDNTVQDRVRKVKFIFTDYFWPKSDLEIRKALKEVEDNLPAKKQELQEAKNTLAKKSEEYQRWLGTLGTKSRSIAEYAQLVMEMRDTRKDPIAQIQAILSEISTEMLKRAGIDQALAPLVILYEYIQGIEYLSTIKEEIKLRKDGCAYMAYPDHSYFIERSDFATTSEELLEFVNKGEVGGGATLLKGQIACKGNVKGVARIISDPHDDKGFQDGDILITSMTRPEFVPLMKRAGAVVTNEGGITCHAAIVSRELKKPCVIGTKSATKIFKTGDMVEVDADNGVVRIIK